MHERFTDREYKRLFFLTGVITIVSAILSAAYALGYFNTTLRPVIMEKIVTIGDQVQTDLELADSAGIPLRKIPGIDLYLNQVRTNSPEVICIGIYSVDHETVYSSGGDCQVGSSIEKLTGDTGVTYYLNKTFGLNKSIDNLTQLNFDYHGEPMKLMVGLDPTYVQAQLADVFFDLLILLVVVLLVSFEIIMVLLMYYVTYPIEKLDEVLSDQASGDFSTKNLIDSKDEASRLAWVMNQQAEKLQATAHRLYERIGNQVKSNKPDGLLKQLKNLITEHNLSANASANKETSAVVDVRIPLFIFVFAEELQKSFMPLFAAENYVELPFLAPEVAVGLPISIFMLVIAIVTPFGGSLADKYGNKAVFLCGLVPAILGYLACAVTNDFSVIIAARAVTAVGYAIIVISSQGYIASAVSQENRVKGMAVFIGVVMSGSMCGTAVGGILADRIGFNNVFYVAASFALVAGVLALQMMKSIEPSTAKKGKAGGQKESKFAVLKNRDFVFVILFSAIPAKIILTGFHYYLVPIALSGLNASVAEIGRVMMLYPLLIIPLSPPIAKFIDKHGLSKEAVILGSIGSGAALIVMNSFYSISGVLTAVVLVSISHALMKASLIASALEAAEKSSIGKTTALGILRTSERIGSVAGPILVAILLTQLQVTTTMMVVGLIVAISGFILAISNRSKTRDLPVDQEAVS